MAESTVLLLKEVHEEAAPIERQELSEVLNQNILSEASNADIVVSDLELNLFILY